MKKLVSQGLFIVFLATSTTGAYNAWGSRYQLETPMSHTKNHPRSQTRPGKLKLMPISKDWTPTVASLLGVPSAQASSPKFDLVNHALTQKIDFKKINFDQLTALVKDASLTFMLPSKSQGANKSKSFFKLGIKFGNQVMPAPVFENMIKIIMCASIVNADQLFFQGNQSDAVSRAELDIALESITTHYSPAFETFVTTLLNKLSSPFIMKTVNGVLRLTSILSPSNVTVKKLVNGINSINIAMLSCAVAFNKHKSLSDTIFNWVLKNNNQFIAQDLTPLGYMVIENQPARVLELLNKGFNPNVSIKRNNDSESLLSLAIRSGSCAVAKILIDDPKTNLRAPAKASVPYKTCLQVLDETIKREKTATQRTTAQESAVTEYESLRDLYLQKLQASKR